MKGARCDLNATGPAPGPSAAVRRGERLVEIHVDHVEAEIAGPREAEQRVQVRAVHVHLGALRMAQPRRLEDARLEQPERVGHGDHQRGDVLVEVPLEVEEIHLAVVVRLDLHRLVARDRGGRGVRAVRRVGDEDLLPRAPLPIQVVRPDHQDARQLALGAGGRLERDRVHPARSRPGSRRARP